MIDSCGTVHSHETNDRPEYHANSDYYLNKQTVIHRDW